MNAKEVKFTAPEESANVSIEFSGDGVKSFSKNVKVQGDEPIPEKPEQVVQPVVKINGKSDKIVLDSRKSEFEADITVEYGSCSADSMPLDEITFTVTNAAGVTGGSTSQQGGAARMTFANLGTVAAAEESLLATISISGSCLDGHQINQEIKVYVPEKEEEQYMMWLGAIDYMDVLYDLVPNIDMIWDRVTAEMIPAEVRGDINNPICPTGTVPGWTGWITLICQVEKESEIALEYSGSGREHPYSINPERLYFEKDGKQWFAETSDCNASMTAIWTIAR